MENILKFINENKDLLEIAGGILLLVYEVLIRIFPTGKNRSLIDLAWKIINKFLPNKKDDGTTRTIKIIAILMLIAASSHAQLVTTQQAARFGVGSPPSTGVDTTILNASPTVYPIGTLIREINTDSLYYKFPDGFWHPIGGGGGGGATNPAGNDTEVQYNNSNAFGASSGLRFNKGVSNIFNLDIGTNRGQSTGIRMISNESAGWSGSIQLSSGDSVLSFWTTAGIGMSYLGQVSLIPSFFYIDGADAIADQIDGQGILIESGQSSFLGGQSGNVDIRVNAVSGSATPGSLTIENVDNGNIFISPGSAGGNVIIEGSEWSNYVIDQATVSTAGGTVTLDQNNQFQRSFVGSAAVGTPKTVAQSNVVATAGTFSTFNFFIEISDATPVTGGILTCPSDWISSNPDWNGTSNQWSPPSVGLYEIGGSFNNVSNTWNVKFDGPSN